MNVQRILEEPLAINGEANPGARMQRIREVLDEVRLSPVEDFLPRFPHMLSGGQHQPRLVARAIIPTPHRSVPDEPVAVLTPPLRTEIRPLLAAPQSPANLTIIY